MTGQTTTARRLAALFVLYGLLAVAFLAVNIPPFQNPDEPAHFWRAAQVAEGGMVGRRFTQLEADGREHLYAGGILDPALAWAFFPFDPVRFHPDTRATLSMWARPFHWTKGRWMLPFPDKAIDPPVFYAPAALGILIGHISRMTVVQSLVLSRLLTGIATVAVGTVAIACAGGAAVWLFALLTLPMSLSLIASSSQDALMLTCCALAGALLLRLFRWPGERDGRLLAWIAVLLALVSTARVPHATLAILPLGLTRLPLRSRVLAVVAVVAAVLAWSGIASATALTNYGEGGGADAVAQMDLLRHDPLLLVQVTWRTLMLYRPAYVEQFVGGLSWLDLNLPPAYHVVARLVLLIAAIAAMLGLRGQRIGAAGYLVMAVALLATVAGLFASQYVIWTRPGNPIIEGMQGRYLLPVVLACTALLPALGSARWARLQRALVLLVAAFPLVSLAVVMRAVVLRYYLQ